YRIAGTIESIRSFLIINKGASNYQFIDDVINNLISSSNYSSTMKNYYDQEIDNYYKYRKSYITNIHNNENQMRNFTNKMNSLEITSPAKVSGNGYLTKDINPITGMSGTTTKKVNGKEVLSLSKKIENLVEGKVLD